MLIEAIKNDVIDNLVNHAGYTQNEAEKWWEDRGDEYLGSVFSDMSYSLTEMLNDGSSKNKGSSDDK